MTLTQLVSVVITTKNEEKNIENCLKSVVEQVYPQNKIEIIVVDNNSDDRTKEIAKRYTKLVFNRGPERSAQRNYGIKKAGGKYILFLDADMSLSEGVIEECVEKFISLRVNQLVGLYIPEGILGSSYRCKVRNFERSFYNATVIDCVRFFPRKVWKEVGGFDETITGPEDWDFDKKVRMKGTVDIITSLLFHNEKSFNIREYLKGKNYYSQSFDKYIKKWGKDDPDIKKQFGFYYRYFTVFIEKGKWKKLILKPFLSLGMYSIRFIIGAQYFKVKLKGKINKIIPIFKDKL